MIDSISKMISKNIKGDTELQVRIKTAAIFGFIFLVCLLSGGFLTNLLFILIAIIVFYEFSQIISVNKQNQTLYKRQLILATIYSAIPFACILAVNQTRNGNSLIFWFFCVIWATDSGAYFIGRYFGGKKLIPTISAGKTVSGAIGGLLSAFVAGFLLAFLAIHTELLNVGMISLGFIAIIISVASQASDALESYIKRIFKIKDSGTILPGHGGMMDRMDSVTLAAPIFLLIIKKFGI